MPNLENDDKVTISLFSKELGAEHLPNKFGEQIFAQKENIQKIKKGLTDAAEKRGKTPPEIVVSILLIPDWKKEGGNSYTDPEYLKTKKDFFEKVEEEFSDLNVTIQNFYEEGQLTAADKKYMHTLEALGSSADIIKTRAILNNNQIRHLQIDSNTIIKDYDAFYGQTFGAPEAEQKDALNACYYNSAYVSAHNKVVYTVPNGKIAKALQPAYDEYIAENQDNAKDKTPEQNSVYGNVFPPALSHSEITYHNQDVASDWHFYPAKLDAPEYRITNNVVTAINMSWAAESVSKTKIQLDADKLKKLPHVIHGDAEYDFQSIAYIIKKYTGQLPRNAFKNDNASVFYEKFLNMSDYETDMQVLGEFYKNVIVTNPELTDALAKVFPDTPKGNLLTQSLFDCTAKALHENSKPSVKTLDKSDVQKLVSDLVANDRAVIAARMPREPEIFPDKFFRSPIGIKIKQMTISSNYDNEKNYNFISAIEKGVSKKDLLKALDDLSSLPTSISEQLIKEGIRILENGSDSTEHFNYILNRTASLSIINSYIKKEKQLESKQTPLIQTFDHIKNKATIDESKTPDKATADKSKTPDKATADKSKTPKVTPASNVQLKTPKKI